MNYRVRIVSYLLCALPDCFKSKSNQCLSETVDLIIQNIYITLTPITVLLHVVDFLPYVQ